MGMKLLKSKAITRRTQYYRGCFVCLHKLEAEGILDVEIEKVNNRMRKYYKLTEAGTENREPTRGTGRFYQNHAV
jgi:hypothetical protein